MKTLLVLINAGMIVTLSWLTNFIEVNTVDGRALGNDQAISKANGGAPSKRTPLH